MDPNVALRELLSLAREVRCGRAEEDEVEELAARVIDLDRWLAGGGFLPSRWAVRTAEECNHE